jgi:hypothetical protein
VILIALYTFCGSLVWAQNLKVRVEGDRLRVSATQLRLITGRPLERLHNGATVPYVLQLSARTERAGRVLTKVLERFTLSYDLWEEKFTVTRLGTPARSASNLTAAAAEAWCLDNLFLPIETLAPDRPFWVELEFETEELRDPGKSDDSPFTLSSLIDVFSRRGRDDQQIHGVVEVGPLRIQDLRMK